MNNASVRMTVSVDEFMRRFLMHALPDGFQRIRLAAFWRTVIAVASWR